MMTTRDVGLITSEIILYLQVQDQRRGYKWPSNVCDIITRIIKKKSNFDQENAQVEHF